MAGAQIGTTGADNTLEQPTDFVESDRRGQFALQVIGDLPRLLFARDSAGQQGALLWLEKDDLMRPVEIRLAPLVTVSAEFDMHAFDSSAPVPDVSARVEEPHGVTVAAATARSQGGHAALELRVPPGAYRLLIGCKQTRARVLELVVPTGQGEVKLEPMRIEPTLLALQPGEPPPEWHVTDARGISADVRLADLRGRWLLICVSRTLPFSSSLLDDLSAAMQELRAARSEDSERYAFLAFYDGELYRPIAPDLTGLDRWLARPEPHGKHPPVARTPPCPVLLDNTGTTGRAWGLGGADPELLVLIDPNGLVVETRCSQRWYGDLRAATRSLAEKLEASRGQRR